MAHSRSKKYARACQLIKLERKDRKARHKLIKRELAEKNLTLQATSDGNTLKIQFFKVKPKLSKQERQEKIHAEYANQEKRKAFIIRAIEKEKGKIKAKKEALKDANKIKQKEQKNKQKHQQQTHQPEHHV